MKRRVGRIIIAVVSLMGSVWPLARITAQTSGAQQRGGTTIEGTVYDSLSHGRLRDAAVSLVATDLRASSYNATSDSIGHYVLRNVQPGTYLVGFMHPLLDSIGIEPPTRRITIAATSPTMRVDLAVPGEQRIHDAICGASAKGDSTGIFVGHVEDALTRELASGATVTAQWAKYGVTDGRLGATWPTLVATATPDGWFAFCGLPAGGSISFIAVSGGDSSGVVSFEVPARTALHHDFYVARTERITRTFASDSANKKDSVPVQSQALLRGPAHLRGIVEDAARDRPLPGVQVGIVGTGLSAVSNQRGEFTLAELPLGTHALFARKVGYLPWQQVVDLFSDDTTRLVLKIPTLKSVLDTIKVTATHLVDRTGFSRRQKTGLGHYFDANQIAAIDPFETSDLLRRVPSIIMKTSGIDRIALMSNHQGGYCQPTLYLDGARMDGMNLSDLDQLVPPDEVAGMEAYTSPASAPPEFTPIFAQCGSIVVWTGPPRKRKR